MKSGLPDRGMDSGPGSRSLLWGAWLLGFFMFALMLSLPPMLGLIQRELSLSYSQAGFLLSAPILLIALSAVPAGLLADRFGPHATAGLGIILVAVFGSLRGVAGGFPSILLFSCLLGAGVGLIYPALPKLVGSTLPSDMAAKATAIYTVGINVGATAGLGATMTLIFPLVGTWRGSLFLWSALASVAILYWWGLRRGPACREEAPSDPIPLVPVWRRGRVWILCGVFAVGVMLFYAMVGWLPEILHQKGASIPLASFLTSLVTLLGIPTTILAPLASERLGLRKPFLYLGFLFTAACILALPWTPLNIDGLILVVAGIALDLLFVFGLLLIAEVVEAEAIGRAGGLVLSVGYLGGVLGPSLTGYLRDVTGGFDFPLLFLGLLSLASIAAVAALPETGRREALRERSPRASGAGE